jgi:hypothetical protein
LSPQKDPVRATSGTAGVAHTFEGGVRRVGFRASETDPALFVKGTGCDATYILVWVDNILLAGKRMEEIVAVKRLLGEVFDVRDLGEATYFLGMEVTVTARVEP